MKVTEQPDPRIIFLCQPTCTLRNAKTFACFLGDLELFFSAVLGVARRSVPSLSRLIEVYLRTGIGCCDGIRTHVSGPDRV